MKRLITFLLSTAFLAASLFAADSIPLQTISYSFEPEQIKHLDVNFAAGKIQILQAVTNTINVTVTKDYDAPSPTAKIDKETLSIKTSKFSSYKKPIDILVEVPYGKNFGEVKVVCVSANTYLKYLNAKQILVTTLSGLVNVQDCTVNGILKVGSASGKTSLNDSKITNTTLSSVGGEIVLQNITSSLIQTETMSGIISLNQVKTKAFESQSSNGVFEAQFDEMISEDSWAKTKNGTISLVFPKDCAYKAVVNSMNGQFIDNNTAVTAAQCENLASVYNKGTVEILLDIKNGKASISSK